MGNITYILAAIPIMPPSIVGIYAQQAVTYKNGLAAVNPPNFNVQPCMLPLPQVTASPVKLYLQADGRLNLVVGNGAIAWSSATYSPDCTPVEMPLPAHSSRLDKTGSDYN
jgi:hypothetical protein